MTIPEAQPKLANQTSRRQKPVTCQTDNAIILAPQSRSLAHDTTRCTRKTHFENPLLAQDSSIIDERLPSHWSLCRYALSVLRYDGSHETVSHVVGCNPPVYIQ